MVVVEPLNGSRRLRKSIRNFTAVTRSGSIWRRTRFRFRPSTRKAKSWWRPGSREAGWLLSELPRCLLAMGAAHIGVNGLACLMTFRAGEARRNRWERVAALSAAAMLATGGEACFTLGMERRHARAPAPGGATPTPNGASGPAPSSSASRIKTRRSKARWASSSGADASSMSLAPFCEPRTRIGLLRSCAGTTMSCRSMRPSRGVRPACQRLPSIARR
jgi:hypothetical protein